MKIVAIVYVCIAIFYLILSKKLKIDINL